MDVARVSALVLQCFGTDGGWQEGHAAHKNPRSSNPRASFLEQVEEETQESTG